MRSLLSHTQPRNVKQISINVVYSVPCECGDLYCEDLWIIFSKMQLNNNGESPFPSLTLVFIKDDSEISLMNFIRNK